MGPPPADGAQWEYAARGGTTTALWTGRDDTSMDGAENLYDLGTDTTDWRPGDDRGYMQPTDAWPLHAPVGSFRANPFGLFDVLGNALEWTLDAGRPYSQPLREGDGCTSNTDIGSIRGGSFSMLTKRCRVSARLNGIQDARSAGFRVANPIQGGWTQDQDR
ncbi:MAG: SUMF1/EgtB/PvdO family nonheme iron enzyme [Phycisphaerales bacterium]|nr:SUMF1/EgtB/PvdO family nonheme iron enzyme [Phycisphaerales bacterium]